MAKKVRTIGILVTLAIIIGIAFSVLTIQANSINEVEKFKINNVYENSADLSWHKVTSAEGYFVYAKADGKEDFTKIADFKNESVTGSKGTVDGLEQGTKYDIYITAYKHHRDKIIESSKYSVNSIITVPSKQEITLNSLDEGLLDIAWNENNKATGYDLEYVQVKDAEDKDFKDAQSMQIVEPSQFSLEIEGLEIEKIYSARLRSYIEIENDVIYGEWSDIKSVEISKKIEMESNIDPSKPMIALTFDDGPGYNSASDKILDVLEKYGAKATFFMVGQNAKDHPKNVKRKIELGCEIGNHTNKHTHYGAKVTPSDISTATKAIKKAGGVAPTAFRSPGGMTTDTIRKECKKENMVIYYWSLDTLDWKYRDADKVYKAVMNNVEDGDIILMHEIYDSTAEAVEKMVPKLIKKGYQLVTCEELVRAKSGEAPKPGVEYLNGTKVKK